jgi:mRNA interferase MazF
MMTTTHVSPSPERGDVFWVDLDPVIGSEQAGRRPVLVLSDAKLHSVSRRTLVCPITSNISPWPTKILIRPGCVVSGTILVDQARMIDRSARDFRYIGRMPEDITLLARELLASFVGIDRPDRP